MGNLPLKFQGKPQTCSRSDKITMLILRFDPRLLGILSAATAFTFLFLPCPPTPRHFYQPRQIAFFVLFFPPNDPQHLSLFLNLLSLSFFPHTLTVVASIVSSPFLFPAFSPFLCTTSCCRGTTYKTSPPQPIPPVG